MPLINKIFVTWLLHFWSTLSAQNITNCPKCNNCYIVTFLVATMHVCIIFYLLFTRPMKVKFYVVPQALRREKSVREIWLECSTWSTCLQMLTNVYKCLLLKNRWACFHKTWHGTPANSSLFKWWPYDDLDQFTARSVWKHRLVDGEKVENNRYFGNYCSLSPENWQKQTLTNEGMRLIMANVISWPGSKVIEISKLFFSVTSQPMNIKFYLKPSCIGRMKFCSWNRSCMLNMAVTLTNAQNCSKIFSRTDGPVFLKLGM